MRAYTVVYVFFAALLLAGSRSLANPLDSDGDGLTDWIEINMTGTNPNDPDTDDDGLGDLELPEVVAWGQNNHGQANVPPGMVNPAGVGAGGGHGIVLLADGKVIAWGRNTAGQTNVPPSLTNATMVSANGDFNLALLDNGTVDAWGAGGWGQTTVPGNGTNAVAVGAGTQHGIALLEDGSVEAWGRNDHGQCDVPTVVTNTIAVAGGSAHSAALLDDGNVVAWGRNINGQTNVPVQVTNAVALAANGGFNLALLTDGDVVAWGQNNWGQANVPAYVTNAVAVAAGGFHGLALLADGTVTGWGNNDYGQTSPPANVTNTVAIDGGGTHSIALCMRGDPLDPDMDDDGILDGDEVANGLDPLTSNIGMDSDSDGMSDIDEVLNGLDPLESNIGLDSDADGLPDGIEVNGFGTDPTIPGDDDDGDGLANDWEIARGMDPLTGNTNFHFVDVLNPSPSSPHTNWLGAANTIQQAVDVAESQDTVLVAGGVYSNGTRTALGYDCLNRLMITNDITVLSLGGPGKTLIVGAPDSVSGGLGSNAVRCVYMTAGVLSGFTVTNGHTMADSVTYDTIGGGLFQHVSSDGFVSNCVLVGNSANTGGGNYGGTLIDCVLSGNSAALSGGGTYFGSLFNCTISNNTAASIGGGSNYGTFDGCTLSSNTAVFGGGGFSGTFTNCVLSGNLTTGDGGALYGGRAYDCVFSNNTANQYGGGCANSTLYDCLVADNSAQNQGGGSHASTLNNCTLSGNSAHSGGGSFEGVLSESMLAGNSATNGAGSCFGTLNNCILTDNTANNNGGGSYESVLHNCTVSDNSAANSGGGIYQLTGGALTNCIVWGNTAAYGTNWNSGASPAAFSHCNTLPGIGDNCITNDPKFTAADDFHLLIDSPCINAGTNLPWMAGTTDFDGHARIIAGTVDIGAYEDWLDSDGDSLTDWAENNLYGTDPFDNDTDDDGVADGNELAWGSNPLADSTGIISYGETLGESNVVANPAGFGLYTSNTIYDLSMGYLMIQTSNGWAVLSLQLEQTTNLVEGVWTNAGEAVEWIGPAAEGKAFFRVRGEP